MKKMMTYTEANQVLGSSLSPNNYCICKQTAIENGADTTPLTTFEYNRLVPASAVSKQDQPLQYHITFADGMQYAEGAYFYMNDGSFVPVANSSSINANDVAYVAWLGQPSVYNGQTIQGSFLIDKNESSTSITYTTDADSYGSYSYNVYTHKDQGYGAVQQFMLNSPVVQYCNTTFDGDGQVPSLSQLYKMLNGIDAINTALQFIGGTPLKTNTDIGSNSDEWYYLVQNKYWSYEPEYESENGSYTYGMQWVGGYNQYNSGEVIDPQTHMTTTEYYYVPSSYRELATSNSITAFVRAIKPIDELPPAIPIGTIYYEYDVNAGIIPECPQEYTPQDTETEAFNGWNPALYAADKNQIYTPKWRPIPQGGDDPSNPYSIYCEGVASGGTIYVDVHQTSVGISWYGPDPADQNWDVTGGGSGGSAQAGYRSWGDGYVNNLDFTSTTTIQSGGYVSYTVTGIHPAEGGSTSISGYWNVEVVESHS